MSIISNRQRDKIFLISVIVWGVASFLVAFPQQLHAQTAIPPYVELTKPELDSMLDAAWSPDGEMLAVAEENNIVIYTEWFQEIRALHGHTGSVTAVDWVSDGTKLASTSEDGTIRIWNMTQGVSLGNEITSLEGFMGTVENVAWSPDGSKIASVAVDNTKRPRQGGYLQFKVWIWDAATWQTLLILDENHIDGVELEWSPDSTRLLTDGDVFGEGYKVRIWDISTGEQQPSAPHPSTETIYSLSWQPNSELVAVGSRERSINIADLSTATRYLLLTGHCGPVARVAWNSDGSKLASGSTEGEIIVWDFTTAQPLLIYQGHISFIRVLEWQPSGNKLVSLSNREKTARVWDVSNLPDFSGTPTVTPFPTIAPTATVTPHT